MNVLGLVVGRPVQQGLVEIGVVVTRSRGQANPQRHPDLVVGVLHSDVRGNIGRHQGPGGPGDVRVRGGTGVEPVPEGPGITGDGSGTGSKGQRDGDGGVAHADRYEGILKERRIGSEPVAEKRVTMQKKKNE